MAQADHSNGGTNNILGYMSCILGYSDQSNCSIQGVNGSEIDPTCSESRVGIS